MSWEAAFWVEGVIGAALALGVLALWLRERRRRPGRHGRRDRNPYD